MDTPALREPRACPLYGANYRSINRRAILGGAVALATLPAARGVPVRGDPVARVRAAMGGPLLRRIVAIEWAGTATVLAGGRILKLGVETRIEPFVRARSHSWVLSEGRSTIRTLMIERESGFAVVAGAQRALPPLQVAHERQQYGLYGLMLFGEAQAERGNAVRATHPGLPPALFTVGGDGMPATADYVIDPPEPGPPIREHAVFAAAVADQGVRWPRRIALTQDGKPFLALAIADFRVELGDAA